MYVNLTISGGDSGKLCHYKKINATGFLGKIIGVCNSFSNKKDLPTYNFRDNSKHLFFRLLLSTKWSKAPPST